MRVGECGGLEWKDIDWKRDVIHVRRTMSMGANGHIGLGATTKTTAWIRDIGMNTNIHTILQASGNYTPAPMERWLNCLTPFSLHQGDTG